MSLPLRSGIERRHITVHGTVQGVGFRPFVYRLATELKLVGWVVNSTSGVTMEVEGPSNHLQRFQERLHVELPPHAAIEALESRAVAPCREADFIVRDSHVGGRKETLLLPDLAICPDCTRELLDPADRRYHYPFINCTNCGPRYTIITGLPYDRARTTMQEFVMCRACRAEYENPGDRRFHAQPNACPACGPHLELWDAHGATLAREDEALSRACDAVRVGSIVAVKGLGGFHLVVDARNDTAVRTLRERKSREERPFALMYPKMAAVRIDCDISEDERALLSNSASPIVLLRRHENGDGGAIAPGVAPGNPYLGVMLPYTPLHHLLLRELGFPVVATSGNRADEPICTDEREALVRLSGIADLFLVHNRSIARFVDDSVVRMVAGRPLLLRRARGYAPGFIPLAGPMNSILAVGAHLKNTVAVSVGDRALLSPHIGDLETAPAYHAFHRAIDDVQDLYEIIPQRIACDRHPDYLSSQYARTRALPTVAVQHHYAHILACMADNGLSGPVLGVAWDGTGLGTDRTIWGGEFLSVDEGRWSRAAHLRSFRLPGGDAAVVEPRRAALGVLYEIWGDSLWEEDTMPSLGDLSMEERRILAPMLARGVQSPVTTSAGRLFDALASLVGLRQMAAYEGQAAMLLEFAATRFATDESYPYHVHTETSPIMVDWEPLVRAVIEDVRKHLFVGQIAARFHNTLAEMIVAVARCIGETSVVLAGGCFQNKVLTEQAVARLRQAGFDPYWHRLLPPNDGSIALGQIMAAVLSSPE
ncbi:MAG: carbamoyltransferase HypF [Candidatus Zixiibacteriota bacterium]